MQPNAEKIISETRRVLEANGTPRKMMSPRVAAMKCSISHTTIYDMINLGRAPSSETTRRWAHGMNENVAYWLRLCGHEEDASHFEESVSGAASRSDDPWLRKIMGIAAQIPMDRRDTAANVLEALR